MTCHLIPKFPNWHFINPDAEGWYVGNPLIWFSAKKGFGFIESDASKDDVFVHFSAIKSDAYKTLAEGDKVEFDVFEDEKGPRAKEVVVVSSGSAAEE